jgi:DNA-binding response OmpR family regulator
VVTDIPSARLLIVEDDARIGAALQNAFERQGFPTGWVTTGADAVETVDAGTVDVVLLDLGLPDTDGISVCRILRQRRPDLLIIMVTARADDMDVVAGLVSGADDYVTKPFRLAVLLSRVRAHLRRRPPGTAAEVLRCGELTLEPGARRCTLAGQPVHLRLKHFELLELLLRDRGRVVTREDLITHAWGDEWEGSTRVLDVHIAFLRQMLADARDRAGDHAAGIPRIGTVRSVGYRLEDTSDDRQRPFVGGH